MCSALRCGSMTCLRSPMEMVSRKGSGSRSECMVCDALVLLFAPPCDASKAAVC